MTTNGHLNEQSNLLSCTRHQIVESQSTIRVMFKIMKPLCNNFIVVKIIIHRLRGWIQNVELVVLKIVFDGELMGGARGCWGVRVDPWVFKRCIYNSNVVGEAGSLSPAVE